MGLQALPRVLVYRMRKPAISPVVQTASRPTDPEDVGASKSQNATPNGSANPHATAAPKKLRIGGDPEMEKVVEDINAAIDAKAKESN